MLEREKITQIPIIPRQSCYHLDVVFPLSFVQIMLSFL